MGHVHNQSPYAGIVIKGSKSIQRRKELNWTRWFLLHASAMLSQEAMGAYFIDSHKCELNLHLPTKTLEYLTKTSKPQPFIKALMQRLPGTGCVVPSQ